MKPDLKLEELLLGDQKGNIVFNSVRAGFERRIVTFG
jgi:hypothetical protein